jgi:hypothetical protein
MEALRTDFSPAQQAELPDDTVVPNTWCVATKWEREEDEHPQIWEQRVQVILPNGRIPTDVTTTFDLVQNASMRNIVEINGFAVRPVGRYQIVLSLRRSGEDDAAWQLVATYPITVTNVYPPQ